MVNSRSKQYNKKWPNENNDYSAPLPICSPGMLQNDFGIPVEPEDNPADYPLRITWNGIIVDDEGNPEDIITRIREAMIVVWKDNSTHVEQDACEIIGVKSLREYFNKPAGFFSDHLKQYSKSRRKAPIYWQLSTPSASYSVWLYYHRFTKDTFYKVLNDYVIPKLQHEERKLTTLQQEYGPNATAKQRKEISTQETFVEELQTFKQEVTRIAPLWNPNLNDGVIINFAPLWRLVPQLKPWQKECKKVWDKLVKGDYDWAHLSMHLWPERVVPKCLKDRSLAIAHDLEENLWYEADKGKWYARDVSGSEIDKLIRERTSASVKAALDDLLSAPVPASTRRKKKKK
ncbi:hypothetical protein QUF76_11140 [Desulfobacterales bacterium HSG16]|nr:hypothetical protein [Desulfobacterales bacterium HSG16]